MSSCQGRTCKPVTAGWLLRCGLSCCALDRLLATGVSMDIASTSLVVWRASPATPTARLVMADHAAQRHSHMMPQADPHLRASSRASPGPPVAAARPCQPCAACRHAAQADRSDAAPAGPAATLSEATTLQLGCPSTAALLPLMLLLPLKSAGTPSAPGHTLSRLSREPFHMLHDTLPTEQVGIGAAQHARCIGLPG
jgi:hypothetical protein